MAPSGGPTMSFNGRLLGGVTVRGPVVQKVAVVLATIIIINSKAKISDYSLCCFGEIPRKIYYMHLLSG